MTDQLTSETLRACAKALDWNAAIGYAELVNHADAWAEQLAGAVQENRSIRRAAELDQADYERSYGELAAMLAAALREKEAAMGLLEQSWWSRDLHACRFCFPHSGQFSSAEMVRHWSDCPYEALAHPEEAMR